MVYGDVITDFNLSTVIGFHQRRKPMSPLALLKALKPWEVGIIEIDNKGRLLSFAEKHPRDSELGDLGSGGVYVLEKEILNYIPAEGFCDFAYGVFL